MASALVVAVASCSGPPKPPQPTEFTHPQYGKVTSDDARYAAARKACEQSVYRQGVDIAGRRVTDPDEAIRIAARGLVEQARPAGARAGGAIPAGIEKPAYFERLHELDRQADTCMVAAGWQQNAVAPKAAGPLSADIRRDILRMHREGRLKLTPERKAGLEKDL